MDSVTGLCNYLAIAVSVVGATVLIKGGTTFRGGYYIFRTVVAKIKSPND